MTQLRKRLKTISFKNEGLQRVLRTCRGAVDVISVEKHVGGIHNTKVIFLMEDGEERVQFYDRVDITLAVPSNYVSSGNIAQDILNLNSAWGCDFNADDVTLIDGKIKAKPESLGYCNFDEVVVPTPSTLPGDEVSFNLGDRDVDYRQESWPYLAIRLRVLDNEGEEEAVHTIMAHELPDQNWTEWAKEGLLELFSASGPDSNFKDHIVASVEMIDSRIMRTIGTNYIIKLKNISNKTIEVCINGIVYNGERGTSSELYEARVYQLLSNTRLLPAGSPADYSATSDTARLKAADITNWPNGLFDGNIEYPDDAYVGELLSINGGQRNSWWSIPNFDIAHVDANVVPLSPYMEGPPNNAFSGIVRMFMDESMFNEFCLLGQVDPEMIPRVDKKTLVIMKNMMNSPISINHSPFKQPVNLLPYQDLTHPDEVLVYTGEMDYQHRRNRDTYGNWKLTINGESYFENVMDAQRNYHQLIDDIMTNNPQLDDILELNGMVDPHSETHYIYARNKTNRELEIILDPADLSGDAAGLMFRLAPAGTPQEARIPNGYTGKDFGDELGLLEKLGVDDLSQLERTDIIWRGLTINQMRASLPFGMLAWYNEEMAPDSGCLWAPGPFREQITVRATLTDGSVQQLTCDIEANRCPETWQEEAT